MSDGWHDDPFGRYPKRYYDGTQWTQHVADHAGATQVDPYGTQPSPGGMPTAPPVGQMPAGYGGGPKKSGAVLRFLARLIDGIIIGIPLYIVLGAMFDDMFAFDSNGNGGEFEFNFPIGALILQIAVYAAYDIYMHGTFGRTIGKMVVGVTVVQAADGSKINYGIATVRFLGWLVYYIPFIGWILFIVTIVKGFSDPKGQTIHDSIAKTMVASSSSLK
jgi:uncharacterized RDD family membrane protein YckC